MNEGRTRMWREEGSITLAILPFLCSRQKHIESFADGLCLQMSSMLTKMSQVSVIAYQAVKGLCEQQRDYKELGSSFGFNHIITGGVQHLGNKIRVNIQLIDCNSYRQLWSETFERTLTQFNSFEVQDEICGCVTKEIEAITHKTYEHNAVLTLKAG